MGRGARLTFYVADMALPATLGKCDLLVAFCIAPALFFGSDGSTVRTLDAINIIAGCLLCRTKRHAAGTA